GAGAVRPGTNAAKRPWSPASGVVVPSAHSASAPVASGCQARTMTPAVPCRRAGCAPSTSCGVVWTPATSRARSTASTRTDGLGIVLVLLLDAGLWCEHPNPPKVPRIMRASAILLFLGLAWSSLAHATVYAPMDEATLAGASPAIVSGNVLSSAPRRIPGGIVTDTAVAVDHLYKGEVGSMVVTVTTPGGRIGNDSVVVYG